MSQYVLVLQYVHAHVPLTARVAHGIRADCPALAVRAAGPALAGRAAGPALGGRAAGRPICGSAAGQQSVRIVWRWHCIFLIQISAPCIVYYTYFYLFFIIRYFLLRNPGTGGQPDG